MPPSIPRAGCSPTPEESAVSRPAPKPAAPPTPAPPSPLKKAELLLELPEICNTPDGMTLTADGDIILSAPNWNDDSDAVTNWVSHPLLGATNFLVYRSRGHGLVASSLGVVLQSFLLEYTIEATYNRPSLHDLVITPLLGIPIGYGLDSLSVYLLKKEEKPLRYLGYVFNPFNLLPTAKESRWRVTVDPIGKNVAFSMRY